MGNKIRHGARVNILFETKIIGRITNFTPNEDYGLQPAYGIGNFEPQELVQTRFGGNFTFSAFLIEKEKVKDLQYIKTAGKSLKAAVKDILSAEGFTIQIIDKYTGDDIETYSGCKIGARGLNVTENAFLIRNGSGMYTNPAVVA